MAIKSKSVRISARQRSKFRIRKRVTGTNVRPRISVFKSSKHIYAQLISDETGRTIASASTLDPEVAAALKDMSSGSEAAEARSNSTKSVNAARVVGLLLAKRSKEHDIDSAVFDRNGFSYLGRIKAVAEGAREGGLQF